MLIKNVKTSIIGSGDNPKIVATITKKIILGELKNEKN